MKKFLLMLLVVLIGFSILPISHLKGYAEDIPNSQAETYYLFVRNDCPHCAKVEAFIKNSKIDRSLNIKILDIADSSNAELLEKMCRERSTVCEGVPTFIYKDKVISGDTPIIDYFQSLGYKAVDWSKWVVIGLIGGALAFVVIVIILAVVKR